MAPKSMMKARIPFADHTALVDMAKAQKTSMADLARQALVRALAGKANLPPRLSSDKTTTMTVPYEVEQGIRHLAAQINMSVDEVVRYAIHDFIENTNVASAQKHRKSENNYEN